MAKELQARNKFISKVIVSMIVAFSLFDCYHCKSTISVRLFVARKLNPAKHSREQYCYLRVPISTSRTLVCFVGLEYLLRVCHGLSENLS